MRIELEDLGAEGGVKERRRQGRRLDHEGAGSWRSWIMKGRDR